MTPSTSSPPASPGAGPDTAATRAVTPDMVAPVMTSSRTSNGAATPAAGEATASGAAAGGAVTRGSRLRELSRSLVLGALGRSGPISQTELVRETGLSRATVASIVAELRQEGRLIAGSGPKPAGRGRPAVLLSLSTGADTVIGVDFGHAHVAVAVARLDGTVLAEHTEELDVHGAAAPSLDRAATIIADLLATLDLPQPPVLTGVGIPGPIEIGSDAEAGPTRRVCAGTVLPSWAGHDPAAELTARTGIPAIAENDVNLGVLGESRYGIGRGVADILFVKVSSGIGTGMILDGRLYRGSRGASGEIGHVQVREDGALCRCGSRGCLETVSSANAALALLAPAHGRPMSTADLFALEAAGDPGVLRLLTDMGTAVGKVVAVITANLDPKLVIVGGSMARAALVDSIAAAINRYNQPYVTTALTVVPASLGERASLMGAIAFAVETVAAG